MIAGVLSGPRWERSWLEDRGEVDFYDVKGIIETLFDRLGIEARFFEAEDPILHPGKTANITVDEITVGVLGEVHPEVVDRFEISSPSVYLFELDLPKLLPLVTVTRSYKPLSRYPSILRDIAIVVEAELPSQRVLDIIQASPLVSEFALFDVYKGEQIPPAKKSLAYRIVYRSPSRTLTDEEVDQAQSEILNRLQRELGATLRGQ
jgi:phenylalanyl-tRNA synthetase beta chain